MARFFYDKITAAITEDTVIEEFRSLLNHSFSPSRFDTAQDLEAYLIEGALLNINAFGSQTLSIPSGQYMVWMTDAGHTMLVPAKDTDKSNEVFENTGEQYEIYTKDLLRAYQGLGKTLNEEGYGLYEADDDEEGASTPADDRKDDSEGKFELSVDPDNVDRTAFFNALENAGMTETELANKVGVDVSFISRLMREPKPGQGDPGGRNPSIEVLAAICKALSTTPANLFPKVFRAKPKTKARSSNRASGSGTYASEKAFKKKGE